MEGRKGEGRGRGIRKAKTLHMNIHSQSLQPSSPRSHHTPVDLSILNSPGSIHVSTLFLSTPIGMSPLSTTFRHSACLATSSVDMWMRVRYENVVRT